MGSRLPYPFHNAKWEGILARWGEVPGRWVGMEEVEEHCSETALAGSLILLEPKACGHPGSRWVKYASMYYRSKIGIG